LLPAYSPDLNPIEQAFAKLKAGLRKVGARTRETLWATIGRLLATFSPDECRNYLANSGYEFERPGNALRDAYGDAQERRRDGRATLGGVLALEQ
jgi:hypothetical protein